MTKTSRWKAKSGAVILCLALAAGLARQAAADGIVQLRVAAQQGTEPKFLQDEASGKVVGLCVDIMRAIERAAPDLRFVGEQRWMPLVRVTSELAAGLQDAACALQRTKERIGKFDYLEPPLYPVNYVLLARADDPVEVGDWDDMRKLQPTPVVLVNRGFGVSTTLQEIPGIHVDASTTDTKLNLQKLVAGRARFYFHRGPGIARMLERAGVTGKVRILPHVMFRTEFYFVLGRHVPAATAARVKQALATLEQSGELKAIYKKWD